MMDKLALSILRLYSERTALSLKDIGLLTNSDIFALSSPVRWLLDEGYLEISDFRHQSDGDYTVSTKLAITQHGRNFLSQHKSMSKDRLINEIRAWITLTIALAAFIKSFFF